MDINSTLIVQTICFVVFVWLTMRYIWPSLTKTLEDRRKKIADDLAASEQARSDVELAERKVKDILLEAKTQAAYIIEQAHQRSNNIIEESKTNAHNEGERLLQLARNEIQREINTAKQVLLEQVFSISVAGAEKILQREIDKGSNHRLIDELVREIN